MPRRLRTPAWLLTLFGLACQEGEISLLEPPSGGSPIDAPACNPDPQGPDPCPDAGAGGAAGAGGSSGTAGTGADAGGCGSSLECTSGGRPVCNPATGLCVECASDPDCDSDRVCDSVAGECTRPCRDDVECSSGDQPLCDTARRVCVQCRSDADCRSDEPRCLINDCVECVSDADCTDPSHPSCGGDRQCRSPD